MSDFGEFEHALPRTAVFTIADGRRFLMEIASQDCDGNMKLAAIEGQAQMRSEDFAQLQCVTFIDELGRTARPIRTPDTPTG